MSCFHISSILKVTPVLNSYKSGSIFTHTAWKIMWKMWYSMLIHNSFHQTTRIPFVHWLPSVTCNIDVYIQGLSLKSHDLIGSDNWSSQGLTWQQWGRVLVSSLLEAGKGWFALLPEHFSLPGPPSSYFHTHTWHQEQWVNTFGGRADCLGDELTGQGWTYASYT